MHTEDVEVIEAKNAGEDDESCDVKKSQEQKENRQDTVNEESTNTAMQIETEIEDENKDKESTMAMMQRQGKEDYESGETKQKEITKRNE